MQMHDNLSISYSDILFLTLFKGYIVFGKVKENKKGLPSDEHNGL